MTVRRGFWILEPAEPIPEIDGTFRPLRAAMLATRLRERGHDVTFWTSDFDHLRKRHRRGITHSVSSSLGQITFLAACGYRSNADPRRLLHNRGLAREFRRAAPSVGPPDLILSCVPSLELAEAAIRFAKSRSIPAIADARDQWPDIYQEALRFLPTPISELLIAPEKRRARRLFHGADAIVAVSDTYLRWALAYAGRDARPTDRVFPLGYPNAERRSQAGKNNDDRIRCVFVGSFGQSYDLESVIDAAWTLQERGDSRFLFVLAGDGDQGRSLRQRASRLQNVEFTGWLSQSQITEVLSTAAVGLMPYTKRARQSVPNKPYEYWAHGLPVVSSLPGECAEIIEANSVGMNYRPEDVPSLIDAIERLTVNPAQLAEYQTNASRLFQDRFSEDRVYGDYADYLEEIATRSPEALR